ncbi:MAG: alpha/beta fold hydrolase [Actinomycetota bacterium]
MTDGLLLIHAFPLDARMWGALATGHRVVAPNLPGFGGTPGPDAGVLTMSLAARACSDALDRADLDRAVVCGLSMGGYVAFELWRTARGRVAGLILANTRAEADSAEAAASRRTLAERLRTEGNVVAGQPPPLLSPDAPVELQEQVRSWIADQPPHAIAAAALGMAERPDSSVDLPGIDVPTLVITSDADALIPQEISAPMADEIPGSRLEVIGGAGHLTVLERPDVFARLVHEHMTACGINP